MTLAETLHTELRRRLDSIADYATRDLEQSQELNALLALVVWTDETRQTLTDKHLSHDAEQMALTFINVILGGIAEHLDVKQ